MLVDVEELQPSACRVEPAGCRCRRVLNTSRSLSPTRSTMAWKSSLAAMPCWMLLMTASSALRCSVSFSRRCVSSNRRAFSSATPMLAATVVSRRTSDFAEGVLALVVLDDDDAQHAVAAEDRDRDRRLAWSVPGIVRYPSAACSATRVDDHRLARRSASTPPGDGGHRRQRSARLPCSYSYRKWIRFASSGRTSGCRCRRC